VEVYITREELIRALAGVQGVVERRSTHQILGFALLTAMEDFLQVTATDQEITVINRHAARILEPGVIAANAAHFFSVARILPDAPVHLVSEENHRLVVDAPPAHFRLMGTTPDDFPAVPPFEASAVLTIGSDALRQLIDYTSFAIPTDDNRYGLNGGHLESTTNAEGTPLLRMVTTDGSRLCYAEAPYQGQFGMGRHMLVPRKALVEVRKLLTDPEKEVTISFGERAATFTVGSSLLHTRLVEGEFPAYRSVLPTSWLRKVTVQRIPFLDALRRVSLEAQDRASTVRVEFSRDEVLLSARSVDQGEARHPVPISLEGAPIVMGFNVKFFLEVVNCLEEENLTFEMGEALSPCVVKAGERSDVLFIIMPIRLE